MTRPLKTAERVRAEFTRRRLGVTLIAAALGGISAFVLLSHEFVSSQWLVSGLGGGALVLATGALSWWTWRCPQCRRSLGEKLSVKQCAHCGALFRRPG